MISQVVLIGTDDGPFLGLYCEPGSVPQLGGDLYSSVVSGLEFEFDMPIRNKLDPLPVHSARQ
jgi:hypothetical protein